VVPPEPLVPPELPEPLLLPDPLLPDPLVLPDPPVPPELPELLDPLALPDPAVPESVEPLVVLVVDAPALSPLLPPHAVSANATRATSNPLRTNDVFIIQQPFHSNTVRALAFGRTGSSPQVTSSISGRIPPTTVRQTATVRNATGVAEGT
jgi:hypothetical protein